MFSQCLDLGPKYHPVGTIKNGWAWMYYNEPAPHKLGKEGNKDGKQSSQGLMQTADGYYGNSKGGYWHPGFAWAARRSALDSLGCLLDRCIVGSADWHMAAALIGQAEQTLSRQLQPSYKREVMEWQERAVALVRGNIGYVDGLLTHHWHGRKVDRHYSDRWRILVDNKYDPELDLKRDAQGLYQLTERCQSLRCLLGSEARR